MTRFFTLCFCHFQLFSFNYRGNLLFSIKKENAGILLGVENKNQTEFFISGGFQIALDNIKIQILINNIKNFQTNIAIKTKSDFFYILIGIQYSDLKQYKLSIGAQINYDAAENIEIIGSVSHLTRIENMSANENEKENEEQKNEEKFAPIIELQTNASSIISDKESVNSLNTRNPKTKKIYQNINKRGSNQIEMENQIIFIPSKKECLLDYYIKASKQTEEVKKLFYNLFHFFHSDIITYIENDFKVNENTNEKNDNKKLEIQNQLRETFKNWIIKMPKLITDIDENEEEIKEICEPILQEERIESLITFLKTNAYNINYQRYANKVKNLSISRKIDGIGIKITNLICDYNFKESLFKYFSYPTIEAAAEVNENTNLKEIRKIKSNNEYVKTIAQYTTYATTEEQIKIQKKTDEFFNYNLIVKEVLLEFVPKLMYIYCNIDHAVLVIEDKSKFEQYDSNKITLSRFCRNLSIQSGSNCCLYSLFLGILTKLLGDPVKAIKACMQMNQFYNLNDKKIPTLVINIFKMKGLEQPDKKTAEICEEFANQFKYDGNFQKINMFGDLLRTQIVAANITKFISYKETMNKFKEIIQSEQNVVKKMILILEKKDLQRLIYQNWDSVKQCLIDLFKKCKQILQLSNDETEKNCQKLYNTIFEDYNDSTPYKKIISNHLILAFNKENADENYMILQNININQKKFLENLQINFSFALITSNNLIIKIANFLINVNINQNSNVMVDSQNLTQALIKIWKIIQTIDSKINDIQKSIKITAQIVSSQNIDLIKKILENKIANIDNIKERNENTINLSNDMIEILAKI